MSMCTKLTMAFSQTFKPFVGDALKYNCFENQNDSETSIDLTCLVPILPRSLSLAAHGPEVPTCYSSTLFSFHCHSKTYDQYL